MKHRFAGKVRRLVLGPCPGLSLREARDRRADAPRLLRNRRDPGIEAAKAGVERTGASANTFEALALALARAGAARSETRFRIGRRVIVLPVFRFLSPSPVRPGR